MSSIQSEAMTLAHQIREDECISMSEALESAWGEINNEGGENMELTNPVTGQEIGWLGILAGVYGVWALYKRSFFPWRTSTTAQKLLARVRPRSVYPTDKLNTFTSVVPVPGGNSHKPEDESIQVIHP